MLAHCWHLVWMKGLWTHWIWRTLLQRARLESSSTICDLVWWKFPLPFSFFLQRTSTFVEIRNTIFLQKEEHDVGCPLFWGASEERLWCLLLHCVSIVSFAQSYLLEVNYSGPEWAFLLGPWADFNYCPLPVWIEETREERLACLLPVKHIQKQRFTQKLSLCFLCCRARQQTNAGPWRFYCLLERNSSFSVWGAITLLLHRVFCLFCLGGVFFLLLY